MSSTLHAVRSGNGRPVYFVHGSAADSATWTLQLQSGLRESFAIVTYDRRGCGKSPKPDRAWSVEDHCDDLRELIAADALPAALQPLVVGSSFGAVVVLDLIRRFPALVAGAVLIEPPLASSDHIDAVPRAFLTEYDRLTVEQGGEAAAEYFLRTVLGDAAYERMPKLFAKRSLQMHESIRLDSEALLRYQPRYQQLRGCAVPVLLVGGDRSAHYFASTLSALEQSLGNCSRVVIEGAGHMLHAEAAKRFNQLVTEFAARIG